MEKKRNGMRTGMHHQPHEIDARDNGQRKIEKDPYSRTSSSYEDAMRNPRPSRPEIAKERSVKK
jgi:hypothetical protein